MTLSLSAVKKLKQTQLYIKNPIFQAEKSLLLKEEIPLNIKGINRNRTFYKVTTVAGKTGRLPVNTLPDDKKTEKQLFAFPLWILIGMPASLVVL